MAHLDHREKGGYTQHSVQFYPRQADNGMPSEGVTGMIFKRNFIQKIEDFLIQKWVNYLFAISSPISNTCKQEGRREECKPNNVIDFCLWKADQIWAMLLYSLFSEMASPILFHFTSQTV